MKRYFWHMSIALLTILGTGHAAALPITLFYDDMTGDGHLVDDPQIPNIAGDKFWQAQYFEEGEEREFFPNDGVASIRQLTENEFSLWYMANIGGPLEIQLATDQSTSTQPPAPVTDPLVIDIIGDNQWHQEILSFDEHAVVSTSGWNVDMSDNVRIWTTELTDTEFGREIAFDHIQVIPEPASLTMLGVGGLMLLGRRRRARG